MQQVYRTAHNM